MSAPYQLFINSFEAVSFSFQISENVILKNLLEIMKLRWNYLKIEEKKKWENEYSVYAFTRGKFYIEFLEGF